MKTKSDAKDMIDRGVYLVIYTGEGQEDDPKNVGWLWLPKGCCKFGQSLKLSGVEDRYRRHLKQCEVKIAGRFKDRDDIDAIENAIHAKFANKRLKNRNGKPSEWMLHISEEELKKEFRNVIHEHFMIF
jgi:hypothetical protein